MRGLRLGNQIGKAVLGGPSGPPAGEVYATDFSDISDLTISEAAGASVTSIPYTKDPLNENDINASHVLDIQLSGAGNSGAYYDLGQAYNQLYLTYYFRVIDSAGLASYTDIFEIGSTQGGNDYYQMKLSLIADQPIFRPFTYASGYQQMGNRYSVTGSWTKIQVYLDSDAGTVQAYADGIPLNLISNRTPKDMRWISFGNENRNGFHVQLAGFTANSQGFQNIIPELPNNKTIYVDYSVDGVHDWSAWTGMHPEPFDPDGGVNYIDGPIAVAAKENTYSINGLLGNASRFYDTIKFKRGVVHKNALGVGINDRMAWSYNGDPYTNELYTTITDYGNSPDPAVIFNVWEPNPADWVLFDAVNNIYRLPLSAANAAYADTRAILDGDGNNYILMGTGQSLSDLEARAGVCWMDGANDFFYMRTFAEDSPANYTVGLSSVAGFMPMNRTQIRDLEFWYIGVGVSVSGIVENNVGRKGAGFGVPAGADNAIVRDNYMYNMSAYTDYRSPEDIGGSGGGITIRGVVGAKFYRNVVIGAYLTTVYPEGEDIWVTHNLFINTQVNTIQIVAGSGDPLKPYVFANNTIYHSPNHKVPSPYYQTDDNPGHGFVLQTGCDARFIFVNNMMSLHYHRNPANVQASSMNLMSFVNGITAEAEIGNNVFYKTPNSTTPAVIFAGGGNDIATWQTSVNTATPGQFTGPGGVGDIDTGSQVVLTSPVVNATAADDDGGFPVDTIDPVPVSTGGGYNGLDFAAQGILTDLAGNPINQSNPNIGAY